MDDESPEIEPGLSEDGSRFAVTPEAAAKATGSASPAFQLQIVQQIANSLWYPEESSQEQHLQAITAAYEALQNIAPQGELEGMLAVQMIGTHNAAMECLRRSMLSNQTFEGRDQNLKHAAKLLGIYERQLGALDKHRGKGRQKITVEHVHVHPGGQAIVGDVHASTGVAGPLETTAMGAPPALTDESNADAIARSALDTLSTKQVPAARPRKR